MRKIIWIDDEMASISYEKNFLLPNNVDLSDAQIQYYEYIDELLEFLEDNEINDNDIFIIDIMLLDEFVINIDENTQIEIENDLMAGATLYTEFLQKKYPKNYYILYTSRENDKNIFKTLMGYDEYEKTLFVISKSQKDTKLISILSKLLKDN